MEHEEEPEVYLSRVKVQLLIPEMSMILIEGLKNLLEDYILTFDGATLDISIHSPLDS